MSGSDLSRSLVDAAAEAICAAVHMPGSRAQAREAVAAVLETLAAHCDPVPVGDGSTSQALLANTELRRLAAEVKSEEDKT